MKTNQNTQKSELSVFSIAPDVGGKLNGGITALIWQLSDIQWKNLATWNYKLTQALNQLN